MTWCFGVGNPVSHDEDVFGNLVNENIVWRNRFGNVTYLLFLPLETSLWIAAVNNSLVRDYKISYSRYILVEIVLTINQSVR